MFWNRQIVNLLSGNSLQHKVFLGGKSTRGGGAGDSQCKGNVASPPITSSSRTPRTIFHLLQSLNIREIRSAASSAPIKKRKDSLRHDFRILSLGTAEFHSLFQRILTSDKTGWHTHPDKEHNHEHAGNKTC